MAPTRRILGASPPSYGCKDEQFTTELHHGGFFSGVGSSRIYLDEKVDWFDYCDSDTWSSLWLDDFIEQLGYDMSEKAKVYWLLPGKTFSDGLRRINSDASTNSMVALAPRFRTLLLYVDHQDILESINWDDVALSTPASIPIVASRERSTMNRKDSDVKPIEGHDIDDDDDIDVDPDFVDSDYEADKGDDDAFDNCVEIEEVASSKMNIINNSSRVDLGPLPESNFIATNQKAAVQPPMTTATKEGRATIRKRKAEPRKRNTQPNKKSELKKREETKKK
ncbi:hypothetical protein OsJ_21113 [Oryza sativa Japonica Group]|uniref:PB1-like domain-containing protein n=1 Tax=Oryza sativa subsp. japonica TaxID=39947 RepID=A3BB37_ORYSJ|nr:hypothetical protein OsJ_21113 [Oryza sativa Japonica Group]